MVAAYAVPGNPRSEGYAKACPDEFTDRHGTVAFQNHMGRKSGHAAVEVGDGPQAGTGFQGNESGLFKFIQVYGGLAGMGIRIRHGQHDILLQQGDGVVVFYGIDGRGKEEVHVVLILLSRFIVLLQDFKSDIRMFLAEAGEKGRNNHGSGKEGDGDCQFLGFLCILQFFLGSPEFLHNAVRMAEQDFAISGEYNVSSASGKSGTPSSVSRTLMVWDRDGWEI